MSNIQAKKSRFSYKHSTPSTLTSSSLMVSASLVLATLVSPSFDATVIAYSPSWSRSVSVVQGLASWSFTHAIHGGLCLNLRLSSLELKDQLIFGWHLRLISLKVLP